MSVQSSQTSKSKISNTPWSMPGGGGGGGGGGAARGQNILHLQNMVIFPKSIFLGYLNFPMRNQINSPDSCAYVNGRH